jgi:predicted amidophosphoribosyltransferase
MLQPSETTSYERNSNTAAGLCANCHVKLHPFETHVCDNCAVELYPDPESEIGIEEEDYGEP